MMKLKNRSRVLVLAAVSLLVLSGAAVYAQRQMAHTRAAAARPDVKVLLSGAIERGTGELVPIEKASTVNPGEILHWTIASQNDGDGAAREYMAVGQIPKGTTLIAGSATADGTATVVYSIDNGKTFSATPQIEEKQADGSVKLVPAPLSMYTQVRYEWADALAGGGSKLNASYKVRVK
ncbi:MAG TPA: hypothetical protein VM911_17750 [Pyrinomonadaceae bacterium]|jgi:uncharacterized repeat protein (TIGR01451 family)|nr:hypothetical protein [Pyrinomonadaceae bacterium]